MSLPGCVTAFKVRIFDGNYSKVPKWKNHPPVAAHFDWLIATEAVKVHVNACTMWKCVCVCVCVCVSVCVCECVRMGVSLLAHPISCRKDVVYRAQQLYAGSSTAFIELSSTTFFFLSLRGTQSLSVCQSPPVLFIAVTMFPRVILRGTMIKKSQQKKRTSPCNYKERYFVLDTQDLKYSERRPGVSMHLINKFTAF